MKSEDIIIIRGAGELGSAIIAQLHDSGFPVIALESAEPTALRLSVSFAKALFDENYSVDDIQAEYAKDYANAVEMMERGVIPVMIDPDGELIDQISPKVVIDAIGSPLCEADSDTIVIKSPVSGVMIPLLQIGEIVSSGQVIGQVGKEEGGAVNIIAPADGCLRGLLHGGLQVEEGSAIGQIDLRGEALICFSISSEVKALAQSILKEVRPELAL